MPGSRRLKPTTSATGTRKRDSKGRFLPAPKPPAPKQRSLSLRDASGRFVAAKKPAKRGAKSHAGQKATRPAKPTRPTRSRVILQDKNGRFRDVNGRFIHIETAPVKERGHHDGRTNDGPRVRRRLTFQEAVDLYEFQEIDFDELPEWTSYLEGAP